MGMGRLGQALTAKEIFDLVKADLRLVEEEIALESVSSVDAITTIGRYLHSSGGKRLRPSLLLLSSKLIGDGGASAIHLGAVVEIIHAATLVHDDVIDAAETRRGRPSTNAQWGNHTSVLAGDWLYMQAFQIAVRERNFRVLDILIALTQMMVEGELLQVARPRACSRRARGWERWWPARTPGRKTSSATTPGIWGWPSSLSTTCWTSPPVNRRSANPSVVISEREKLRFL